MGHTILAGIHALIDSPQTGAPRFPPTLLFNEGWMLRLVLDWFSCQETSGHILSFEPGASWFSEALLPTPFAARSRGDRRAEARTHADGVVGHIGVGRAGRTDVVLRPEASQLLVIEAKLFSALSAGTQNAPGFDQAARNVACMAEMLAGAGLQPRRFRRLAFLVLVPASQLLEPSLCEKLEKGSIERKVRCRAAEFAPALDDWFMPTLEHASVGSVSWEQLIADAGRLDPAAGESLNAFYERCIFHNRPGSRHGRG